MSNIASKIRILLETENSQEFIQHYGSLREIDANLYGYKTYTYDHRNWKRHAITMFIAIWNKLSENVSLFGMEHFKYAIWRSLDNRNHPSNRYSSLIVVLNEIDSWHNIFSIASTLNENAFLVVLFELIFLMIL